MVAVTVREAKENLEDLVRSVVEDAGQIILTTNDGDQAIIISYAEFRSMRETEFLLSDPRTAVQMYKALEELKHGKVITKELAEL